MQQKFPERLAEVRHDARLSGARFAAIIGCDKSYISRLENGKSPMEKLGEDKRQNICKEFNVSYDWLFNGSGNKNVEQETRPPCVMEEESVPYGSATGVWTAVPTDQLEQLIETCRKEKDWMAVEKVARELANRKMKERLP